jgi:hypothetical protein
VRACADALLAAGKTFDVVIANAGVMATPFGHTADGFETQFGTNHLGHFVFVNRIAPLINLSSAGHRFANVDLQDPNFERTPYGCFLRSFEDGEHSLRGGFRPPASGAWRTSCGRTPRRHKTGLGRHMDPGHLRAVIEQINKQLAAEG